MKKSLKILTTSTLATVLLLSGAAASTKAFADEATASKPSLQAESFANQLINYRLSNLVNDTAFVSGKESSDIDDALASGKNLIQVTGLSNTDVVKALASIVNGDLLKAQSFGLISADEVQAGEAEASKKLDQIVTTKGYQVSAADSSSTLAHIVMNRLNRVIEDTAIYSDKDEQDIRNDLGQGKTLLGAASSLESGKLQEKLATNLQQELQFEVALGRVSQADADKYYALGVSKISNVINTPGYKPETFQIPADLAKLVNDRIERLISDTAFFAKKDEKDVRDDLRQGKSLAGSAANLDAGELQEKILNVVKQDLDFAVTTNRAAQADADKYYAEAVTKIADIINTPGYQPEAAKPEPADLEKLVNDRIERVISDTAFFAKKEESDVREDLHQGKSLAGSAANLDAGELQEKILNVVKQDLDFAVAGNRATQADADKYYAEAVSKIADIINTPGYQPEAVKPAPADLEKLINDRIDRLISDTAFFAKKDESDVREDLRQGKSLAGSAASLDAGELQEKILNTVKQDIDFAVAGNRATQADADKYYAEAVSKIADIINTPGYTPQK